MVTLLGVLMPNYLLTVIGVFTTQIVLLWDFLSTWSVKVGFIQVRTSLNLTVTEWIMVETLFYLNKNTFIVLVITLYKRRQEFWSVDELCYNLLLQRLSKNVYSISATLLIKKIFDWCILMLLFSFVCCRFRHASDALVSQHALLPLLPAKVLHRDTADSTWIQTVWCNTFREQ